MHAATIVQLAPAVDLGHIGEDSTENLPRSYFGEGQVADGIWNIVYYQTLLGKIDERSLLITGV